MADQRRASLPSGTGVDGVAAARTVGLGCTIGIALDIIGTRGECATNTESAQGVEAYESPNRGSTSMLNAHPVANAKQVIIAGRLIGDDRCSLCYAWI